MVPIPAFVAINHDDLQLGPDQRASLVLLLFDALGCQCFCLLPDRNHDRRKTAVLANYSYDFNLVGHCPKLADHGHLLGWSRPLYLPQPWLDWA